MKKFLLLSILSVFLYANEVDFADEFEEEFKVSNQEVFDPLSGYNRAITSFNDGFYTHVLSPVSKSYAYAVPEVARTGISNFFTNLMFPVRFVNNLLQFKFENASKELGRFVVNTIWGLGGFMDQATNTLGMEIYDEDFGQTLGYWGVGEGFHVVLPFLGPSNLRDIVGLSVDSLASPTSQMGHNTVPYKIPEDSWQEFGIESFDTVNTYSFHPDLYNNLKKDALDLYPYLRDIYTQKRNKEIAE